MRAVMRLCSYARKFVAIFLYTWLPQVLRVTILALFVALNHLGRAYARYQYKAMVKKQGKKFVYRRKRFFTRSVMEPPLKCAICLAEFAEGQVGRELEKCGHAFHANCVEKWLLHGEGHSSTCPLCRSPVVVPEADVGESWKYERGGSLCFEEDLALLLLAGLPYICSAHTTWGTSLVQTRQISVSEFSFYIKR